jgi:hypothetical protein
MLMARQLVALDKCLGVRPIGVLGGAWRQAITKSVLLVTIKDAKEACGIDQL